MDYKLQTINGNTPSKSNSYRIITLLGHGSLAKTKALRDYENRFFMQSGQYRDLGIDKYFEFHCKVYYPSMRSDLDNSLKILLDCLQSARLLRTTTFA